MITGLDHAVLVCPDVAAGVLAYSGLFGRGPDWQSHNETNGIASAFFGFDNTALELLAPHGKGEIGDRVRAHLDNHGPGLTSLAFSSDDLAGDHHILTRRGLQPDSIADGERTNVETGDRQTWRRFRLDDSACAGIKTFVIQRAAALPRLSVAPGNVQALDHIVIATPNPDRAAAQYGARLGLHLALDRTAKEWKTRFLFFRTGGLTFEVIHRLDRTSDPSAADSIWGLTWAVDDLAAAHARLAGNGFDLSEIRVGRKPGSQVFTVRTSTLDVPTLFISHSPRTEASA